MVQSHGQRLLVEVHILMRSRRTCSPLAYDSWFSVDAERCRRADLPMERCNSALKSPAWYSHPGWLRAPASTPLDLQSEPATLILFVGKVAAGWHS